MPIVIGDVAAKFSVSGPLSFDPAPSVNRYVAVPLLICTTALVLHVMGPARSCTCNRQRDVSVWREATGVHYRRDRTRDRRRPNLTAGWTGIALRPLGAGCSGVALGP